MLHQEESQLSIGGISLRDHGLQMIFHIYRSRKDWFRVYWTWGYHLHNDDRIRKN